MERGDENRVSNRSGGAAKRTISVQAAGEAVCPPDIIEFLISVTSSKETVEAAQTSVKRRTDYVLQALKNNGIKERCIKCSSEINKGENVSVQTDIIVQSDSLLVSETVRNLLIGKLDPSVRFGPITYHHSSEIKVAKR